MNKIYYKVKRYWHTHLMTNLRRLPFLRSEKQFLSSIDALSPLNCIICGYERSGTTVLAELIRQSGVVDGRFEGGFLLAKVPKDFVWMEPYAENLKTAWGVDSESLRYICNAKSWPQVYRRLIEKSNILDKKSLIYDKTPRYMRHLTDVMAKTVVPCLVLVKDPRALFWSQSKRSGINVNQFCHYYMNYANEYANAVELYPERILLVRYEELCANPLAEGKRIYDFLGLDFLPSYIDLTREGDPYVARGGINSDALWAYKSKVSKADQEFILEQTKKFSCWHWYE